MISDTKYKLASGLTEQAIKVFEKARQEHKKNLLEYKLEPCRGGSHTFKEITRNRLHGYPIEVDEVVQWCQYCGGIVVTEEVDGRMTKKIMEMEFPQFVKEVVANG
jgi:hypothetical protein